MVRSGLAFGCMRKWKYIIVCALCIAIQTAMCFEFVSRDIFHCPAETYNTLANVQLLRSLPVSVPATRKHEFHIGFRIFSGSETEHWLSGLTFFVFPHRYLGRPQRLPSIFIPVLNTTSSECYREIIWEPAASSSAHLAKEACFLCQIFPHMLGPIAQMTIPQSNKSQTKQNQMMDDAWNTYCSYTFLAPL
jgi:hypothetical protein